MAVDTFKLIFERSPDAALVLDERGRVVAANRAARELHGDAARVVTEGFVDGGELADFAVTLRAVGRAITEVRVRDAAGAVSCELLLQGTMLGNGQYAVYVRDVTERRAMEAEIAQQRRVESLGFLTASVVHDFNNMLTPVVCLSAVLASELERGTRQASFANEIRATSERAAGLVRQMLAFVRREPRRVGRVNVSSVVGEMAGLLERVMGAGIELSLALGESTNMVSVDREQLEQVLLNLAANARDAMPDGGKLVISTSPVTLDDGEADACACPNGGDYVALSVSDTGVGMTAEVKERVFERFFTTKPGRGNGLGLATAHSFAKSSGGCILVRSAPEAGTTITLFLPRADGDAAISSPPALSLLPRGTETVLVVDDDDGVRGVVSALLEDQGYRVLAAASSHDAIEAAAREPGTIDLVIADVVMPGMHGAALVDALAQSGKVRRALFMSGHADAVIRERGVHEASDALLRKAFTPSELIRKVREALDSTSTRPSPPS